MCVREKKMKSIICNIFLVIIFASTATHAKPQAAELYRFPHQIRIYNGPSSADEILEIDDVLEIVPYGDKAAYFRVSIVRDNGHTCKLYGIADQQGDNLTYKQDKCILSISYSNNGSVTLHDADFECKYISCGMRASYDDLTFSSDKKKQIKYLMRLKKSPEYRAAIRSYEEKIPIDSAFYEEW